MKLKIFFDQEYFSFVREYVNLYNFENVSYLSKENSESLKVKQLKQITDQYKEEYEQLTGFSATEPLSIDYKGAQHAIEREAKVSGDGDTDIFWEMDKQITKDPGLYTLKLATILSQDIIIKVKDVQSFVQWMQLIQQLYGRHAVACVWFIKYMTDHVSS